MTGREPPSFTCPCCGAVSSHPEDVKQGWCGRCHAWTGDPELGPAHLAEHCPVRPFRPDWTLRPGVLLRRLMDQRKIGPATLALRAGMDLPVVRGVLDGTVRVTAAVADRLGSGLGTGPAFWLDVQAGYDADIARGAKDTGDGGAAGRGPHPAAAGPAPHPGEILKEMLIDRQLGPELAGVLCELPADTIENMARCGGVLVNEVIDEGLARGLGTEPGFWLAAQDAYYKSLAAEAAGASEERA